MTSPIPVEETEHSSIGSLFYFDLQKKYSIMLVTDVVDEIISSRITYISGKFEILVITEYILPVSFKFHLFVGVGNQHPQVCHQNLEIVTNTTVIIRF